MRARPLVGFFLPGLSFAVPAIDSGLGSYPGSYLSDRWVGQAFSGFMGTLRQFRCQNLTTMLKYIFGYWLSFPGRTVLAGWFIGLKFS